MATLLEMLQLQSAAALMRLIENPAIDPDTTPPAELVEAHVMQTRGATPAPQPAMPPLPVEIEPTDPATAYTMPTPAPKSDT